MTRCTSVLVEQTHVRVYKSNFGHSVAGISLGLVQKNKSVFLRTDNSHVFIWALGQLRVTTGKKKKYLHHARVFRSGLNFLK